jgi:putative acetyltransferase
MLIRRERPGDEDAVREVHRAAFAPSDLEAVLVDRLRAAEALELPELVLLGNPEYYARFGFRPAAPLGVLPPDPAWSQHFQIRPLTAGSTGREGPFRYAPAFDGL